MVWASAISRGDGNAEMMNNRLPEKYAAPYIIGIGGVGMAGIARLLMAMGVPVAGSDLRASEITLTLEADGVLVEVGDYSPDLLQRASCVITPVSMGYASKVWIYCMTHQIPVLNKVQALSEILSASQCEPVYVLGSTSRGKVARMIAEATHIGWLCGLVPIDGDDRLVHFARRMAVELDDPYILSTPKSLTAFPDGDFVVSDFQFEDYDHYGHGRNDIREVVDRIRREKSLAGRCFVLPRIAEAGNQLSFRIVKDDDFDHAESCVFTFDEKYVYPPEGWRGMPMRYDGTRADASGVAAACAWLRARGRAERPVDIPAVGWFERVAANAILEIRMHPYPIALALEAARKRAGERKVHAVFKPFISVIRMHEAAYWRKAFGLADEVHVVLPGYEGVDDALADDFVRGLRDGLQTVSTHSLEDVQEIAHSETGKGDLWVWFGAPDLVRGL